MNVNPDIATRSITRRFNFHKVRATMRALDWKWGIGRKAHVPSVYELRVEAERLIRQAIQHGSGAISCGGFVAEFREGYVHLSFELDRVFFR